MKNYFGIKQEIFKGNKSMPEETIIYPNIFKTEEDAVHFAMKIQDKSALSGRQTIMNQLQLVSMSRIRCGKQVKEYRHEWSVIKFEMEGE